LDRTLDPYQVLGVARAADKATIKQHYRTLAKHTHPDQGGDADTFARVKLAYDVLMDDERRAAFDANGTIHFVPPSQIDAQAIGLIAELIGNVLMGADDPNKRDLIKPFVEFCANKIAGAEQHNENLERAKGRAEKMAKRFKLKKKKGEEEEPTGPNIMADIARRKVSECATAIAGNETTIKIIRRALQIIEQHRFDFDKVHQVVDQNYRQTATYHQFGGFGNFGSGTGNW
jgi:curved DNA-binding protein CbpA